MSKYNEPLEDADIFLNFRYPFSVPAKLAKLGARHAYKALDSIITKTFAIDPDDVRRAINTIIGIS